MKVADKPLANVTQSKYLEEKWREKISKMKN